MKQSYIFKKCFLLLFLVSPCAAGIDEYDLGSELVMSYQLQYTKISEDSKAYLRKKPIKRESIQGGFGDKYTRSVDMALNRLVSAIQEGQKTDVEKIKHDMRFLMSLRAEPSFKKSGNYQKKTREIAQDIKNQQLKELVLSFFKIDEDDDFSFKKSSPLTRALKTLKQKLTNLAEKLLPAQ